MWFRCTLITLPTGGVLHGVYVNQSRFTEGKKTAGFLGVVLCPARSSRWSRVSPSVPECLRPKLQCWADRRSQWKVPETGFLGFFYRRGTAYGGCVEIAQSFTGPASHCLRPGEQEPPSGHTRSPRLILCRGEGGEDGHKPEPGPGDAHSCLAEAGGGGSGLPSVCCCYVSVLFILPLACYVRLCCEFALRDACPKPARCRGATYAHGLRG